MSIIDPTGRGSGPAPSTPVTGSNDLDALKSVDTPRHKDFSAEEIAEMLQSLGLTPGLGGDNSTQGVPEPERGGRSDGVQGLNLALDDAQANLATDIYAFMAMYTQLTQQMRSSAREQRQSELQAQVSALNTAADKMIEAADARFNAALAQGISQMASGAVSITGGAVAMGKIWRADSADLATGSKLNNQLSADQSMVSGTGQLVTGLGTIISGAYEKQAANLDADAKKEEAKGTAAQARRDVQNEIVQTTGDVLRDIREQLRAMVQSEIETNRGMARNI